jgi:hypothetical protein
MKAGTKMRQPKKRSRTGWKRVDALRDEDIDFSDIPKLGPEFFANAIVWPGPKKQITLREFGTNTLDKQTRQAMTIQRGFDYGSSRRWFWLNIQYKTHFCESL